MRRGWLRATWAVVGATSLTVGVEAAGLTEVAFATNWRAQAEHGGFYQALADGLYAERGLDVTIVQGGPMVNARASLATGRVEFMMGSNLVTAFDAAKEGFPSVIVAAFFQKDVQCLIAHATPERERWEQLKSSRLFIGAAGQHGYYRWLRAAHGFPERVRTYAYSMAPFLADPRVVQQGYLTAEPFALRQETGRAPRVFLLADYGWDTYSTLVEVKRSYAESHPETVRAFVDASILGWVRYLYGDPASAHRLIQKDNPQISAEQLAYSREQMLDREVVDGGDTLAGGVGAMTAERVRGFLAKMIAAGVFRDGEVDVDRVCRFDFVNRGVGVEEKQRLLAAAGSE
ncbi:MAG: ABC transporter substrate-binding protein [Planctomycetota bacterium]